MSRSRGIIIAVVFAVAALGAIVFAALSIGPAPTPAPVGSSSSSSSSNSPAGGGGLVITAFHVITEVSCSGRAAAVPASWATRDARTVSFEVDGEPLPAAAGYPVSGTGNVPVPCDGKEHAIELVAANAGQTAARTQHVNTANAPPPSNGPAVNSFQVLADVTCPGGPPVAVAASWTTQDATTVSFSVDGQPLPAAAGYPTSGAGNVPIPCDGRAHKVTLTAANAEDEQAALSRSVNTTPYAPVPPPTSSVAPVTPTAPTTPVTPTAPPTTTSATPTG